MADDAPSGFDLYRLYLATAEKVSDRRAGANAWMLSVNGAVVALNASLGGLIGAADGSAAALWRWTIPVAGILICLAWAALLESYRKLNHAKFKVLQEIEASFPHPLFRAEEEHYRRSGRRPLARLERLIPWSFMALYIASLIAGLVA